MKPEDWASYDWRQHGQNNLEEEIRAFKRALPGWWYSIGECQVSCDASCAPTRDSPDIEFICFDRRFDDGFHIDLPQPSSLAEALRALRADAEWALRAARLAVSS